MAKSVAAKPSKSLAFEIILLTHSPCNKILKVFSPFGGPVSMPSIRGNHVRRSCPKNSWSSAS